MIRVALVGAGRISRVHARSLRLLPDVAPAGVFDPDPGQAQRLADELGVAAFPTLEALWAAPQVDAVALCSPLWVHHEQVLGAARAGKHIFCEKPIALTLPEADEMLAAAKEAGVVFMVGHVVRYMAEYARIQALAAQGLLGEIRTIYAARLSGISAGSWQGWMLQPGKGLAALDAHIHDLDYIQWLMGPTQQVQASGWQFPSGTWAHATSWLRCDNGRVAVAEGSFGVPLGFPFTMTLRVIGSEGAASFSFEGQDYATPYRKTLALYRQGREPETLDTTPIDPYREEMREFLDCIREGRQPERGNPADARSALALTLAVQRSLETGSAVEIAP
ncbi:MAG: Gfo/Idh/MocA family oxidoreductase [Chloroflexi bacterium]|nr:Gfo/Idh/MocA family oxidoreductase [Chloroflexota bacterium]